MKKVIALVPMKANSERLPNKNILDFCGRPLYWHILKKLEECKLVERVFVNTDSEVIAKGAGEFESVEVIKRPEHLRGGEIPTNAIIEHDLSQIEGEYFLQTHCTNPLLRKETIDRSIETFFSLKGHDSLFTVTRHQTRFYLPDLKAVNHNPFELLRTQDLQPLYEENSNIYIFSRNSFLRKKHRIGERPFMFEIHPLEAVDIDDGTGFRLAEILKKNTQIFDKL